MIEIGHVSKSYGPVRVLDDICLSLPAGRLTAVIGPNGAGKSTLFSVIARLSAADRGCVTVGGLDVARAPGAELARRLAILRQDNTVPVRLTVRELVAFGRYPHNRGRARPEDDAHVGRALSFLGLDDLSERFLDALSGGQRQRAFVAMTLAQDADAMLFDEPLNNLDIRHAVSLMKLMHRLTRELGKTVVVVLHDINFAAAYADFIVALQDGRVHTAGPPSALMQPAVLESLYGCPFTIADVGGRPVATYYT
ncbi:ATP-binding cassette domain-containing protein [Pseudoxanthobacter sp.]|uniref:iron ABC transporter ATP-binding protein n=1 Tax=Pseudoxanthobacter sp. TaxID=1925742 RepID=UPI002FE1BF95